MGLEGKCLMKGIKTWFESSLPSLKTSSLNIIMFRNGIEEKIIEFLKGFK